MTIALALNALEARFDDLPLGAVDHDRHAGEIRLVGQRRRKRVIASLPSIRSASMLTSRMLAPFCTCSRATATAASKLPSLMRRLNLSEPVMLQRSPTMTKFVSGRTTSTSLPLKYDQSGTSGTRRGAMPSTARRDGGNPFGRRAAAAADDVDPAIACEFAEHAAPCRRGRRREAAHAIGQAGVGITDDRLARDRRPGFRWQAARDRRRRRS